MFEDSSHLTFFVPRVNWIPETDYAFQRLVDGKSLVTDVVTDGIRSGSKQYYSDHHPVVFRLVRTGVDDD